MKSARPSSQSNQFITIILVSLVLIQSAGCRIPRSITRSELPVEGKYKYALVVNEKRYKLIDPVITEHEVTGRIDSVKPGLGKKVLLYIPSESAIQKIDSGKVLIPVESISTVRKSKFSVVLTGLAAVGAFYTGLFLYMLLIGGYDM